MSSGTILWWHPQDPHREWRCSEPTKQERFFFLNVTLVAVNLFHKMWIYIHIFYHCNPEVTQVVILLIIWMSMDFTDDQSTLVQVMAWCRQATSHYLSQCWTRSLMPSGVTRPQWFNRKQRPICLNHVLFESQSPGNLPHLLTLLLLKPHYSRITTVKPLI